MSVGRSCLSVNRLPDSAHRLNGCPLNIGLHFDVKVETSSSAYVTLILGISYIKYAM